VEDRIVLLKAVGAARAEHMMKMSGEAIEAARQHRLDWFLADGREMTLTATAVKLYDLPRALEMQGFSRLQRVAIIWSGDPSQKGKFSFLETVFVNRGFQVRLFRDYFEGMSWLKTSSPSLGPVAPGVSSDNGA